MYRCRCTITSRGDDEDVSLQSGDVGFPGETPLMQVLLFVVRYNFNRQLIKTVSHTGTCFMFHRPCIMEYADCKYRISFDEKIQHAEFCFNIYEKRASTACYFVLSLDVMIC